MSALDKSPQSKNFLAPNKFQFFVRKCPDVNFFCQACNVPGFGSNAVPEPTPFKNIWKQGDHLEYDDLVVTFKVDEGLHNYLQIYSWIRGINFPNDWDEYAELAAKPSYSELGLKSDILIQILDSSNIPKFNVNYHDAFPLRIGNMNFSTTVGNINYITVDATFKYTGFDIEPITYG